MFEISYETKKLVFIIRQYRNPKADRMDGWNTWIEPVVHARNEIRVPSRCTRAASWLSIV